MAGITGMPARRFLAGDAAGVAGWAGLHVALGYLIGFGASRHPGLGPLLVLLLIAGTVAVGLFLRHRQQRRKALVRQDQRQ
jgi:membrane protein DedA with SNARE-associated domain